MVVVLKRLLLVLCRIRATSDCNVFFLSFFLGVGWGGGDYLAYV
jgi:hypothetical protein